jgi:PAT family beta-lactamase induction signal transducer AmpG
MLTARNFHLTATHAQASKTKSLTNSRYGRLVLFGLMYFVQGTMLAYFLTFNNLYMSEAGASSTQLGVLNGMLAIPFILKIGIGLLSDKVSLLGLGYRVPYIVLGLLLTSGGAFAASLIAPVEQYVLFLGVTLIISLGFALFDAVNDGMAVDVTPTHERFLIQGVMAIGRSLGLGVTAVYGRLIETYGWQIVFWLAAGLLLAPLPLLIFGVREPAERGDRQQFDWQVVKNLWRPEIGRFGLYGILYAFVLYGATAIVSLFASEELGVSLVEVGDIATITAGGTLLGGLLATVLARKFSIWQQGLATIAAVTIALFFISVSSLENIIPIALLWGACLAAGELIYVTLAMLKSDPRVGASSFAIFMAVSNIGLGGGQAATTWLHRAEFFNSRWVFVALAILNLLCFPLLLAIRTDSADEDMGEGEEAVKSFPSPKASAP